MCMLKFDLGEAPAVSGEPGTQLGLFDGGGCLVNGPLHDELLLHDTCFLPGYGDNERDRRVSLKAIFVNGL